MHYRERPIYSNCCEFIQFASRLLPPFEKVPTRRNQPIFGKATDSFRSQSRRQTCTNRQNSHYGNGLRDKKSRKLLSEVGESFLQSIIQWASGVRLPSESTNVRQQKAKEISKVSGGVA